MPDSYRVLSKETLIPMGVAVAIISPLAIAIVYMVNINNDVARALEKSTLNESRYSALTTQVQTIQQTQIKTDAKLDYISSTLDEIKKKLSIN